MDMHLANHTAVVFGGARGIGEAIARGFAQERAHVAIVDRDAELAGTCRRLESECNVPVRAYAGDVTDYAGMTVLADKVWTDFGRIDHLVFAVGIGSGKFGFPFWNLDPGDWDRILHVNVVGAVNALHAFTPAMRAARSGTVLLVASISGQIGSQTDPPYSASKAALINFAQCAAKDLAPFDVRVNTLCPGMVQTTLNRSVWEAWNRQQPPERQRTYEDWAGEKIRNNIPLRRWQEPEDMAAMAVFLASPRAQNVCGQTINVDGGFVMHW